MDIKFVPMNKDHISDIARIEKDSFSKPWSEQAIQEELTNNTAMFFVAEVDKTAVGYIGVHVVCDEGYIANMAVAPEYRNRGIGKQLLEMFIGISLGMKLSFISLEVRPSNKVAVDMYKKLGFKVMGRRKGFYTQPKEDAYIMTLKFNE